MARTLHEAILDCIAPGGSVTADVILPPASEIIDSGLVPRHAPAIVMHLGADFAKRNASIRDAELRAAAALFPDEWQPLLTTVLVNYYSDPRVLLAFHWSADPPQPAGHALAEHDWSVLGPVKVRKPFWR